MHGKVPYSAKSTCRFAPQRMFAISKRQSALLCRWQGVQKQQTPGFLRESALCFFCESGKPIAELSYSCAIAMGALAVVVAVCHSFLALIAVEVFLDSEVGGIFNYAAFATAEATFASLFGCGCRTNVGGIFIVVVAAR